jgi:hypothetical protein
MRCMSKTSWFNRSAAAARLLEIGFEIGDLRKEQELLKTLLMGTADATGQPLANFGRTARRRASGEPTLSSLIAEVMKTGLKGRAWTVGELAKAIAHRHPGRLSGKSPSSLVSATLSQELRSKQPLFVARKARGKRGKLYRLA